MNTTTKATKQAPFDARAAVAVLAKLEPIVWSADHLHALTSHLIGGPPCSEEARWDVLRAAMDLVCGPLASKRVVIDKKGRDWSHEEVLVVHDVIDWILEAKR